MLINTLLVVILLVCVLQSWWVRFVTKGIRNAGPTPLFLVGNLLTVLYFGTKLEKFIDHLQTKYGNMFEFWMGWKRVLFVGDPAVVKKILTGDAESFEKLHWEKHVLAPVMEGGLIILNGEAWKSHHRAINSFFNSELYSVLCKEIVVSFQKVWPHGKHSIKLQTEFRKLGTEILAKLIFGWSFHDAGILDDFVRKIEVLNHDLEERAKDLLKLRPFVAPIEVARARRVKQDGEKQLLEFIRQARNTTKVGQRIAKFRNLLTILIEDTDFSDLDILHEIKTLFGASETTVHLMTWSLHEISQNPLVEAKLLDETNAISNELSSDTISNCSYLNAVVNECLRMFPPAPAMFRQTVRDVQLNDNIKVDKGTVLVISPFFLHKDPNYWEAPETFMPERFLKPANTTAWSGPNIDNPTFIPFGNGKRQCIGKKFSLIESAVMLTVLLRKYKFNVCSDQKIEPCTDILNRPRFGITVMQSYRQAANGADEIGCGSC
eukprot:Phypoly_transcript_06823.p1 GENE.Phypoly_transcript_06823~~Phypoly_transcript_06823.p1  ORF type:complete len:491 (+),score=50.07 Phypoly_transcript_06823:172-1644(+)